jgi:hypothetical protein
MSIFKCDIKYMKSKGDSEKSTLNNLVAHGFVNESYDILNDDFYKASRELNLLASNKLGKEVKLYDVKRKEDIIYYKDDAIKIGVDEKVKERIFNSQSELDIKNVLLNIQNNSKNSYFSKLASLLNNKILASDNIKMKLVNTKILKGNASGLYYPFYHSNKIFNENKVPFIEIAQKAEAPLFNLESVILHEIIHHLTHKALRNNSKLAKDWEKLYQHVKNTVKEEHYGLSDSDEFSTELFTNSRFIKTLKKYDATNEFKYANLFEELLDFIKSLFKTEYSFTLYDESFALLSNIIDDNYNYLLNQEREKNIEDEYYNQLDYFQFENEEEVLRAIPNTEVFKEIDSINNKNNKVNQEDRLPIEESNFDINIPCVTK